MTTIYAVSSGEYSDYSIHAMFSTRELAESYIVEYANTRNCGDRCTIEEWQLDAESEKRARTLYYASIDLFTGATVPGCETREMAMPEWRADPDNDDPAMVIDSGGRLYTSRRLTQGSYVSSEHALKLCVEQRQKFLRDVGGVDRLEASGFWLHGKPVVAVAA